MKFPYGISDFEVVIGEGYFYADRTDRIRMVEEMGRYLLFLRPRRFGKSLWLSTLENYYDVAKADDFERLFGHLAVGKNPTPLHNRYFILKWDFSMVDPSGNVEQVRRALHGYVNRRIRDFAITYKDWLPLEIPIDDEDALISFLAMLAAVRQSEYKLYLLVDEYDNFANEVMTASEERYYALLSGEGLLKTVFKAAKGGAAGLGVDRMFITGVAPVVMSDITSGYNIASNIYLDPGLDDLCGFNEEEVAAVVWQTVSECGLPPTKASEVMKLMHVFYDGYRFYEGGGRVVYNPTLVLYFLRQFREHCRYPRRMLDANLAMDRAKISYVARLPGGGQVILDALSGAGDSLLVSELADRFGVWDMLHPDEGAAFNVSLLYYLGVLTIRGISPGGRLELGIPNLVTRRLYAEQIRAMLLPVGMRREAERAAEILYSEGRIGPLCDFVERHYFRAFDNRDYRWANELTVKTAFLTLLFDDVRYIVDSEPALERGYADLVLIVRPDMRQYRLLDILIEFKYVGLSEARVRGEEARKMSADEVRALPPVQRRMEEARAALVGYREALGAAYGDSLRLRSYAVVSLGFERLVWEEVGG